MKKRLLKKIAKKHFYRTCPEGACFKNYKWSSKIRYGVVIVRFEKKEVQK